jgi:hypothetical protein
MSLTLGTLLMAIGAFWVLRWFFSKPILVLLLILLLLGV